MSDENTNESVGDFLVNADGSFAENWKDSLDEEIRGEACLDVVGDFKGAMKQLVHAQKNIGKNKSVIPGEDASDEEYGEYFTKVGKPATAGDYEYVPKQEGFKRSDSEVKALREFCHSIHITKKQFGQIMGHLDAGSVEMDKDRIATEMQETQDAEQTLKDRFGMAYEERIHIANRLINETTEEGDQREGFIKKYGRDPVFIEWAADVGKQLVEHELLVAKLEQKAPREAQQELDELKSSDDYSKYLSGELKRTNLARHNRILKQETDLYDIIAAPMEA